MAFKKRNVRLVSHRVSRTPYRFADSSRVQCVHARLKKMHTKVGFQKTQCATRVTSRISVPISFCGFLSSAMRTRTNEESAHKSWLQKTAMCDLCRIAYLGPISFCRFFSSAMRTRTFEPSAHKSWLSKNAMCNSCHIAYHRYHIVLRILLECNAYTHV